jgi:hypothetical protein
MASGIFSALRPPAAAGPARALLALSWAAAAGLAHAENNGGAGDLAPAALEAAAATIGRLSIRIDDIFDPGNPDEDRALYRWANRVHVNTRASVIEDLVLFEPGQPFESRLLAESARLLRGRPYLADATVHPIGYDEATNTVDVGIHVRDAWSFTPEFKLGREGGENELRLGLSDTNLLGLGKTLTAYYNTDVDRNESYVRYVDPNVRGTRTRFEITYADASDGRRRSIGASRPFYSLDTRWSAGGFLLADQRIDSMYDLGDVVDEFRHKQRFAEVQGGLSRGWVRGRTHRWVAGFTYDESRFGPTGRMPEPLLLPADRKLAYPWIGFELIEDDYRQMTELDDMGRTEDVPLGLQLSFRMGFASRSLGSDRDATLFEAFSHKGWELGPGRLFMFDTDAAARRETDGLRNATLRTSMRYYHRNLGDHLFLASLATLMSRELDADQQVLLGGDSGLRGYPLRYQGGEHRAVLTLEQRFHTDWYPLRLFRVAYAAFFDAGRVWGTDPRGTPAHGMLYDVGAGLRLSSPRSSGRSIIHIDLAFPLNGGSAIRNAQLLVETRQSF